MVDITSMIELFIYLVAISIVVVPILHAFGVFDHD